MFVLRLSHSLLPAQVQFLPNPLSLRTFLPRAASYSPCCCISAWNFASGSRAQGPRAGRGFGARRAFVRAPEPWRRGRLGSAGLSLAARQAPAATLSMRRIKNSGERDCRRLAEALEDPFIPRGTEARKSPFKVHLGGSSPESSGYELQNSLVSRGGWGCGICCPCPGPLAALVPR